MRSSVSSAGSLAARPASRNASSSSPARRFAEISAAIDRSRSRRSVGELVRCGSGMVDQAGKTSFLSISRPWMPTITGCW